MIAACTAAAALAAVVLLRRPAPGRRLHALRLAAGTRRSRRPVLRRRADRRLAAARAAETVDAVHGLAAELRAGRPPAAALAAVAAGQRALAEPLGQVAAAVERGSPAGAELTVVAALPGCTGFRAVAAAWVVTAEIGGPVADVLDRVGAAYDEERRHRQLLEAALAGPRTTMRVLAALPFFGLALGQSVGAHPVALLLHRPLGWALLAGAAVLDALGVAWVARICRGAT